MEPRRNAFEQPIGAPVPGWKGAQPPGREPLTGRYCRVEPVDVERHAADLFDAYSSAADGRDWTYLAVGPFESPAAYREHLTRMAASTDPLHYALIDLATGKAVGTFALMRIDPANGVIEVGHVAYSPRVKRTRVATEAMFLLMSEVFGKLGYRRFEWKCDSLNEPSRAAALRYGFTFEGIFRQAIVYRKRNRDTAWFSTIDKEWAGLRACYTRWLDAENFDAQGRQVERLADLIARQRVVEGKSA
ncbi:GNAT family N-acetyltransferase [Paraburkholderia susongensis]|uniref:Protein N-acetyltransferase, RimJ/RimL family n=1 Tax=Paraburkholderia susongensis TaxID=1515439 RepID=A0A1X7LPC9_9BURK|nr:GNAT family protein [Paraburkholderia susongensis]SMG54979.1 Protein N-acetyltransferase, RimJ/RimL family [Paraburkholderia susongensis]